MRSLSWGGRISLAVVCVDIFLALGANLISPSAYDYQDRSAILSAPGEGNILGTDHLGRDVLSRLLWGSRVSLTVGLLAALASSLLGAAVGIPAGFYGGVFDTVVMRVVEVFSAFPNILLAIALMSAFGPGQINIIIALALVGFCGAARLMRAESSRLSAQEFTLAARALGCSDLRIMVRHLFPNALGPLAVYATTSVSWWIAAEAGLSFLGLGSNPTLPSWGSMIAEAIPFMRSRPLLLVAPCLAVSILSVSVSLLGDNLGEVSPRGWTRTFQRPHQYRGK